MGIYSTISLLVDFLNYKIKSWRESINLCINKFGSGGMKQCLKCKSDIF